MVKTLTTGIAALALTAAAISAPTQAQANPAWLVPALIGGGVVVGATALAASSRAQAYEPGGNIYVQPRGVATCHIIRERTSQGWRRVEVCD
jgi:hypothetical protein